MFEDNEAMIWMNGGERTKRKKKRKTEKVEIMGRDSDGTVATNCRPPIRPDSLYTVAS